MDRSEGRDSDLDAGTRGQPGQRAGGQPNRGGDRGPVRGRLRFIPQPIADRAHRGQGGLRVGCATRRHAPSISIPPPGQQLGTIDVYGYGYNLAKSQKFRNVATHSTVAFVVDDIFSHDPWRVRCLEIRGTAQQAESAKGEPLIRITPKRIISFGIDDTDTEAHDLVPDSGVPTTAS